MMLRTRQSLFASMVAKLIQYVESQGYELTLGETWRPDWVAQEYARRRVGSPNSLHCERLAIDINLFKDGQYLYKTEEYAWLGEWWKNLHPDNRWGGDISRMKDGNHFSNSYDHRI